ncbi:MAG: hypothetical protein P4L77_11865 [Sulfuriferula sp.]|nr:hypothetical protein [Sulfuriferula sp.]
MKIIPVFSAQSKHCFCEYTPPRKVNLDGVEIETNYLKTNTTVSLLGVSQTTSLLESGVTDMTDAIDPAIALSAVVLRYEVDGKHYVHVHETVKNDEQEPLTQFNASALGNYRKVEVGYESSLAIPHLGRTFEVSLTVVGSVNIELGDTTVNGLARVIGDAPAGLNDIAVVGYGLLANRVNYNRRAA